MSKSLKFIFAAIILLFAIAWMMCLADTDNKNSDGDLASVTLENSKDVLVARKDDSPPPISTNEIDRASRSFVTLAQKAAPAVVNIDVTKIVSSSSGPRGFHDDWYFRFFGPSRPKDYRQKGQGSGFIIDPSGLIVTNNHVVANADTIFIVLHDGRRVKAYTIGTDPKTDIALLQVVDQDVKRIGRFPTLAFGNSEGLKVGEWLIAIGNPFGLDHTVTAGIVSAKGRVIGAGPYDNFIQTDASINPGNSGGPLINTRGEVVGINTLINASGQGIGFAIPSDQANTIISQLRTQGAVTRGWIGVHIQAITPDLAEALGLEKAKGALVTKVQEGSPAHDAGLMLEDIILDFNGSSIGRTRDLSTVVANTTIGAKAPLKILRNGKPKTITVIVGQLADPNIRANQRGSQELGLTVENVTDHVARRLGTEPGVGVVVYNVTRGSKAADAGLRRGDLILEVNQVKISSTTQFYNQLEKVHEKEKRILLLVKRDKGKFFTTLKPR